MGRSSQHRPVPHSVWHGPADGRLKTGTAPRLTARPSIGQPEMQRAMIRLALLVSHHPDHHPADRLRHHPHRPWRPMRLSEPPAPLADVFRQIAPPGRVIALHRGQGHVSRTASRTKFFLNQKDLGQLVYPNGFRPPAPGRPAGALATIPGWKGPVHGPAMPLNMTMSIPGSCLPLEVKAVGAPHRGADQRHHRYEEAAAQGLMAGWNAARAASGRRPSV
jgi:hypothetical protein